MTFLTEEQKEQFLNFGYVTIRDCFSREAAEEHKAKVWQRLGYDQQDPSTWEKPRVHMPFTYPIYVREFAPKAFAAAVELIGGEERSREEWIWGDGFIMNFRSGAEKPWDPPSARGGGWHKDGDYFRHFLDSPEQALLTLVIWSDIEHQGGATYAAADSVPVVARYLRDHPEGVLPREMPFSEMIKECSDFREITGRCGDVVLLHPYMLHSTSQNMLGIPRFLTNPPVYFKEPMNFNREDTADFSLVELGVLRGLGVDRLDFHPTAPREEIVPERVLAQAKMREEEQKRLEAAGVA